MKTCIYCGKENIDYATVCTHCGNVIGTDARLQAHLRNNEKIVEDMKKVKKIEFKLPRISKKTIKRLILILVPLTIFCAIVNESEKESVYDPEFEGAYDVTIDTTNEALMAVDYVLPESNSRYISEEELYGLSAEQLRIARNEIYARHGRLFNDYSLQAYFNAKSWYSGTVEPESFTEDWLNEYEVANRDLIIAYEASREY